MTRHGTEIKVAINDYSDLELVGFENQENRFIDVDYMKSVLVEKIFPAIRRGKEKITLDKF